MLPLAEKHILNVQPINWKGMHRRYLDMNSNELETIIALIRSTFPHRVIEFGCNDGRTAKLILDNIPTINHYIGIDVTAKAVTTLAYQMNEKPPRPGILAEKDSRFQIYLSDTGSFSMHASMFKPCDAAFIDGDHSWQGLLNDTLIARQVVRPGGIIIWHDYNSSPKVHVKTFLDILEQHGSKIFHVKDTWLAFERV